MRRQAAVAALFLALALVELWTPIVHGGFYMASDLGQIWALTHTAPGSATPANSLVSDVYTQLMPFLHFSVSQVRAGHLPTWNPYNGNGQPFLANFQSALFSPFTALFYVFPFGAALILSALARLWLMGFFTAMLFRRHGVGDVPSVVGGVVFMFAGYHLVWLNYPITSVSAWLPLALWCCRVALDHRTADHPSRRRRNAATAGLALAVAAMLLGGNPETATFDILLIIGFVVVSLAIERVGWPAAGRYLARFAGAGVVAALLAAPQLIPFVQYERISTAAQTHQSSIPGFNLSTVPIMAFPNLFGGPQFAYTDEAFYTSYLHPPTNYAELDGNSVGLIAMCAAPVGLLALRRRRWGALPWFGLGAAAVGTLLLYSHAAGVVWEHVPIVHTAYLNRSQDVELMGLAVLTALAADVVIRAVAGWRSRPRAATVALAVLAGATISVSLALTEWGRILRQHVARLAGSTTATATALRLVRLHVLTELALAAGFVVAVAAFAALRRSNPLRAGLALVMVAVVFASTGLVLRTYNPTVPSSLSYPVTPSVRQLESVVGQGEVLFSGNDFPLPATNLWFGIHDVGSYDSVGLRWHDDLYRRVFDVPTTRIEQLPNCLEGLQLFGVQWVVGGDGRLADGTVLSTTGVIDHVPYYAVPSSAPYALVDRSTMAGSDRTALRLAASCGFDSSREVVLEGGTQQSGAQLSADSKPGPASGTLTRLDSSASGLEVRTNSLRSTWLVVKQSWAPGWRATVDGRSQPVLRADYAFIGVRLPPGRHVIRLAYSY
jgi:hypothetical protein